MDWKFFKPSKIRIILLIVISLFLVLIHSLFKNQFFNIGGRLCPAGQEQFHFFFNLSSRCIAQASSTLYHVVDNILFLLVILVIAYVIVCYIKKN